MQISFNPQVPLLLAATVDLLRSEVAALTPQELAWRPAAGEWSINEVTGHLIEAERRGFAGRIRAILEHERPLLEAWDQSAVAAARGDRERDGRALFEEFAAARRESLRLVAAINPAQLTRSGEHADTGSLSVRDLLHDWVYHDRDHVQQVLQDVKLLMWADMGNTRLFYATDPREG